MPQRKLLQSFRSIVKKASTIFILVFGIFLIVVVLFFPFLVKVKNIECMTQYGNCTEELNKQLSAYNGKSLIVAKKRVKSLLEEENLVNNFTLQFKFPNNLRVDLLIKKPSFCIKNQRNFMLVSDTGIVISISDTCSLPKVIVNEEAKNVGEFVGETKLNALKISSGIYEMYQIDTLAFTENSLEAYMDSGIKVLFPPNGVNPDALLGALRLIVTKIESTGASYNEIDLRFDNPVLR